ncbi:MAG TPA: BMP family ABC transporter substrate-binding protein [Pirellulales bacterium]|jgi:simple sugar transport system substrate-binding protein|nr:BMP family ABC transporter substrate-binding protein [Pirellulales bacterium]
MVRNFRGLLCALLGVSLAISGLSGCGSKGPSGSSGDLMVGFVFVGPKDDYGYNQAHAIGADAVKKIPGVKVVEEERVAEDASITKTMKSMINTDGVKMLYPTSYGYFKPYVLDAAKEFPETTFLHCGGRWEEGMPTNVYTYFGNIYECEYLSGIVAGKTTKSKKLGFIAAKPIPQVRQNINAFELGAKSANPDVTCTVIFTGDWSMPVKEAEAANSLLDQGVDVLTCHVDSPKVIAETAEKHGIYFCGYHCSQAKLCPKGYLTGAEWNWEKVYTDEVDEVKAGKKIEPRNLRGGLKAGIVKMSPYGAPVDDATKKDADAVKAKFMDGGFVIFKGPLKDNTGKEVIPAGTGYPSGDPELDKMDYFVDGVKAEK